jgi:hypothetical protein
MKKSIYYLFMLVYLVSCKEKPEFLIFEPGDLKTGHGEGQRDGHDWKATAQALVEKKRKKFDVLFITVSDQGILREYFRFQEIPLRLCHIKIKNQVPSDENHIGVQYSIKDEDITTSPIYSYTGNHACLDITKIDTVTNMIEGSFSKLVLEPVENDVKTAPRCVVFKNCTFTAKMRFF